MAIQKVATDGLVLGLSAALPATDDQSGFEALTWTDEDSCAIVDAGQIGDAWTEITDNTLCTAGAGKTKGKRELGDTEMVLKYYRGSAVGAILQAAFDSQTDVISVKVLLSNGDTRYFTAAVARFDETYGTTGSEVETPVTFFPQTAAVKVDGT